jgi:hypothetical protein
MSWHDIAVQIFALALLVLCYRYRVTIIEAIQSFRGGPPTNHPSPVNDAFLLGKRRRRSEN